MPQAKEAAVRALELDESLAEAHASLATYWYRYEYNWADAGREYRRALALNPNYASAYGWYGMFLSFQGRHEEAVAQARRGVELEPTSRILNLQLALTFHQARRYGEAAEQFRKVIEIDPYFQAGHTYLAEVYEQQGRRKRSPNSSRASIRRAI